MNFMGGKFSTEANVLKHIELERELLWIYFCEMPVKLSWIETSQKSTLTRFSPSIGCLYSTRGVLISDVLHSPEQRKVLELNTTAAPAAIYETEKEMAFTRMLPTAKKLLIAASITCGCLGPTSAALIARNFAEGTYAQLYAWVNGSTLISIYLYSTAETGNPAGFTDIMLNYFCYDWTNFNMTMAVGKIPPSTLQTSFKSISLNIPDLSAIPGMEAYNSPAPISLTWNADSNYTTRRTGVMEQTIGDVRTITNGTSWVRIAQATGSACGGNVMNEYSEMGTSRGMSISVERNPR